MSSLDDQLRALEAKHRRSPSMGAGDSLDETLAGLQRDYHQKSTVKPTDTGDRLSMMLQALERDTVGHKLKHCQHNQQLCQDINALIQAKQHQQQMPLATIDIKAIAAVEKQRQAQSKYWHTKAKQWLQQLDPISNEGLWFMEFAESYESPLAAAIDYLMALE